MDSKTFIETGMMIGGMIGIIAFIPYFLYTLPSKWRDKEYASAWIVAEAIGGWQIGGIIGMLAFILLPIWIPIVIVYLIRRA